MGERKVDVLRRELLSRLQAKGWSYRHLSEQAGMNESAVKQILSGKSADPRIGTIEKLAAALEVTVMELIGEAQPSNTVKANSFRQLQPHQITHPIPGATSSFLVEFGSDELAFVPVYDLRLSAGPGAWCENDGEPLFFQPCSYQWLRAITTSALDHLLWARADGDSMEPTIHDADMVLIDRSRRRPSRDGIYGLRWDDSLLLKRVAVDPRNGLLTLSSDNTRYPTYAEVRPDSVDLIGRSVWLGRKI